jgi:hypothetical protein
VKYGILESLYSNVDIAKHCYGMKKRLGQINTLKLHHLEFVVIMEKSVYQQSQNLLLSFKNS